MRSPSKPVLVRLYVAWYFCLGLAFASLAWRSQVYGGPLWGILLRLAISLGFIGLAVMTLRAKGDSGKK
ncbi:MAG: hypothetical protein ABI824_14050 [Acidobacteriota bacterium]